MDTEGINIDNDNQDSNIQPEGEAGGGLSYPLNNENADTDSPGALTKRNQKIAVAVVCVVGVAVVVLGLMQMKNSLKIVIPGLKESPGKEQSAVAKESNKNLSAEDPAVLKKRDTDEDGINDFEELYIYSTSPYLADSDSDGTNDLEEIEKGSDPTCPEGQNCFRKVNVVADGVEAGATENNSGSNASGNELLNVSPEQLRQLLLQSGKFTQEQIDKIDDQTLLSTYQDTLKQHPELLKPTADSGQTSAVNTGVPSIVEIKQMLRDQGISEADISKFDDATLLKMYREALQQVGQNSNKK